MRQRAGLAEPVEPVHGEHRVGGLGGGARSAGAHGDPDVGQGQRGGVVDPVSDHDGGRPAAFEPDGVQLVGRGALGQHLVHADHRADGVGDLRAVAGDHDDPADPAVPQRPDRPGGIGPERVVQDERTGRDAVDRDEHGQRPVEPGPAARRLHPRRLAGHPHPAGLADGHPVAVGHSADALPGHLFHLLRQDQRAAAPGGRGDHRTGQDVPRYLVQGGRQPHQFSGVTGAGGDDVRN